MLMNTALKQSARLGQQRLQSTTAIYAKKKGSMTVKNTWLQDPSTYPMIVCMAFAGTLVVGVGVSNLLFSPDVQISPSKRGSVVRTWSF